MDPEFLKLKVDEKAMNELKAKCIKQIESHLTLCEVFVEAKKEIAKIYGANLLFVAVIILFTIMNIIGSPIFLSWLNIVMLSLFSATSILLFVMICLSIKDIKKFSKEIERIKGLDIYKEMQDNKNE